MKYTTFIAEIQDDNKLEIPVQIREKLDLRPGDKMEITVKKIKARRLEILINENPLYKFKKFAEE